MNDQTKTKIEKRVLKILAQYGILLVLAACQPGQDAAQKSAQIRDDVRFLCIEPAEFQMSCTGVHTRDNGYQAVYCKANDTSQTQSIGFRLKDYLDAEIGLFGAGAGSRVLPNVMWVSGSQFTEFREQLDALYGHHNQPTYDLIMLTISDKERVFWDETCHPAMN